MGASAGRSRLVVGGASLLLLALGGCGKAAPPRVERSVAVEVMTLEPTAPERVVAMTGVAQAYKQAAVGFDVGGRLLMVRDVGEEVRGPGRNPDGSPRAGDVLAILDDLRYRQAARSAELELETARAALDTMRLEVETLLPESVTRAARTRDAVAAQAKGASAGVDGARATRDNAKRELDRLESLAANNRISGSELDKARTSYESAASALTQAEAGAAAAEGELAGSEAALREAEAQLTLRRAALQQQEAQVATLAFQLDRRQTDLDDTVLRAPFDGRITDVKAARGGFVQAGGPVVQLTLLDPIQVAATVASDLERSIVVGQRVQLAPQGLSVPIGADGEPLFGQVYEKASIADAATRTFRIDIMVRNWRLQRAAEDAGDRVIVSLRQFAPVIEGYAAEDSGLYVFEEAVVKDGDQDVVLLLADEQTGAAVKGRFGGPARLRAVPVEKQPGYRTFLGWTFRHIRPLEDGALPLLALVYAVRDPMGDRPPTEEIRRRGVFVETNTWALRPGDLVPVSIRTGADPEGYWVPVSAIADLDGRRQVFRVDGGVAHAVPVRVTQDARGTLRRIEGEGLSPGLALVTRGVAYLADGVPVTVHDDEGRAR